MSELQTTTEDAPPVQEVDTADHAAHADDAAAALVAMDDAQILAADSLPIATSAEPAEESTGENQEAPKESGESAAAHPVDYEAFYKQVMQPVQVAGRKVEIRSPEEALRLMQMGADYTRKTQAIAPHRKAIAILEKNGLLSEEKLDFLVALEKKDPQALKKYLADAQIDPMNIDMQQASEYQPGQHLVPDAQIAFEDAVNHVSSTPQGQQFMQLMNDTLDDASKQALFMNPDALPVLLSQKQSGVFDAIAHEVDRLRMLGHVPAHVPFIEAYRAAGEAMQARGEFARLQPPQQQPPQQQLLLAAATTGKAASPLSRVRATRAAARRRQCRACPCSRPHQRQTRIRYRP